MATCGIIKELGPLGKKVLSQCDKNCDLSRMVTDQVRIGDWTGTLNYVNDWERVRNAEVRPSDVWVLSFPKCGTTWMQEMSWALANDCDLDAAKSEFLHKRWAFIEFTGLGGFYDKADTDGFERFSSTPRSTRRFIKSHLPVDLLPKDLFVVRPKIFYVARDPRDAVVSFFHHYRGLYGYTGTFEDFFEVFCEGDVLFGSYWAHVLEFWEVQKQVDCIMFVTFEEMKKDLRAVVKRAADFLDVTIPEGKEEALLRHLGFEAMKGNPMVNNEHRMARVEESFIRKGEAGGWKRALSPEQSLRMKQWARDCLQGSDYPHFSTTSPAKPTRVKGS